MKVEQVRKSYFSSIFRVQYNIPVGLYKKWEDPSSWPAGVTASESKGNPKVPLNPLKERLYTKRIYIGNLSTSASLEKIQENLEDIYEEEMKPIRNQPAQIQKIEAFWNTAGINQENMKKAQDPSHQIVKSVCILLTSNPGKDLSDVSLKELEYPAEIRRTIHYWRDPVPRERPSPTNNLTW